MNVNLELFQPIDVPASIKPFVRRAMFVHSDDDLDIFIEPRPTGYQYLNWVIRGELIQESGGNNRYGAGSVFLPGQVKDHELAIRFTGKVIMLLIEFSALGCYELFGINGSETLNRSPTIASLSPVGAKFESKLVSDSESSNADDIKSKFGVLVKNLELLSHNSFESPDYLVAALKEMEARDGAVKITQLCKRINISRRQFTRKFKEVVGIPPKHFCRVIQMNKAMEALMSDNIALISEIANNAGYFDEAHLINTVQAFFGLPAKSVAEKEHPAILKMHSSSRKV